MVYSLTLFLYAIQRKGMHIHWFLNNYNAAKRRAPKIRIVGFVARAPNPTIRILGARTTQNLRWNIRNLPLLNYLWFLVCVVWDKHCPGALTRNYRDRSSRPLACKSTENNGLIGVWWCVILLFFIGREREFPVRFTMKITAYPSTPDWTANLPAVW